MSALRGLPGLLEAGPTKWVPAGCLDARKVAIDVVTPGWACDEDWCRILSQGSIGGSVLVGAA